MLGIGHFYFALTFNGIATGPLDVEFDWAGGKCLRKAAYFRPDAKAPPAALTISLRVIVRLWRSDGAMVR